MTVLAVIGVNHRTAPVEVRERLALPEDLVGRLLRLLRSDAAVEEAMVLATCNRTELYTVARKDHDGLGPFLDRVARLKESPPVTDTSIFYRKEGLEAVRHLLRVAASLDSQIVGEHQILGQVKDAYRQAVEAQTTGFLLNKLLHRAFRVGKRVQTETDLGRGSAGIAQAAVELAGHLFEHLAGKTVLLVGAGRNAECAARALLRAGAMHLIVANRTVERAQQLAAALLRTPDKKETACRQAGEKPVKGDGGPTTTEAVGLEDLEGVLGRSDLVITSTGSAEAVLTYEGLADGLRRRERPLFIVDIAMPRDVDARLGTLPNVYLYNLDDLDRLVERNLERRRREIPRAEAIVESEVEAFGRWLAALGSAPTIRLLQEYLDSLREAQIERYGRKFAAADREPLERFAESLCNRILHKPLKFLKRLAEDGPTGEQLKTAELVRRMFGLKESDET